MTTRMFFKDATPRALAVVNGHGYNGDPNRFIDAPDADIAGLVSAGGWVTGPLIGPSGSRPTPAAGTVYIDTDLGGAQGVPGTGRVIIYDGSRWLDVMNGSPV
jgi:hypothetical protein